MTREELLQFVATLPHLPGVYRMLGEGDAVLYVGKARDLRKRVASYFQKSDLSPRIRRMVAQILRVETTITRSEAEALLLENNLIKALNPKYNILFRDDKSYPYIQVTGHRFPQIAYYRGALDKQHRHFGPFPNGHAAKEALQLLQRVFLLRTCDDSTFAHRTRPCLLHQIKRCTAPCVGLIDAERYQQDVNHAMQFLEGKDQEIITDLTQRMNQAAADWHYEDAARYRDQIQSLHKAQEKQFVSSNRRPDLDADIIAAAHEAGQICVNLVMVRGGRHWGDRSYFPGAGEAGDLADTLEAFITQHYLERPVPGLLVVHGLTEPDSLASALSELAQHKVRLVSRPVGERRVWLGMAEKNALLALQHRQQQNASQLDRLQQLAAGLRLDSIPQRIECFDISHTMGEATIGSCVVYDQLGMRHQEYRRFNVNGITPGDDYAAMRQVLERRYARVAAGEGKQPDLILIDGGKGQLGIAEQVLGDLGLGHIPLLGVAKGESRKPGLEQLIVAHSGEAVQWSGDHPGLHLIQQIRDEAHRFAISGHRNKRAKARVGSQLDDIPGVGPKRRQRLLARFGSVREMVSASVDDLASVEGISRALAEDIYQRLHG